MSAASNVNDQSLKRLIGLKKQLAERRLISCHQALHRLDLQIEDLQSQLKATRLNPQELADLTLAIRNGFSERILQQAGYLEKKRGNLSQELSLVKYDLRVALHAETLLGKPE